MDLRGFDADQVQPNDSFDPLPAGDYLCVITHSEEKPTKAGTGSFLELQLEVIEGPHQGRKLWDRLNLNNPSEVAVKIAQATLSAICRAVGVERPQDSCELHDLPLLVKVRVEKRADTDEQANVVKGYKARPQASSPPTPSAATAPRSAPPPPPPPAGQSVPPWKRPAPPARPAAADAPF
jgi:hypothetical protein